MRNTTTESEMQQVIDDDCGFTQIRNEILYSGLTAYQIRVYAHLKSRAWGNNGRCWDSKNQMAAICGIDERTLKRTLTELENFGLLIEMPLPANANLKDERARKNQRAYRLPSPANWSLPPNSVLNPDGTYRRAEPSKNDPTPPRSGCKNVPTSGCKNVPTSSILVEEDNESRISPLKGRDAAKLRLEPPEPTALISHSPETESRTITPGSRVWKTYSQAMQQKWNYAPPRNAKVSAQAKQLVDLVGIDNAMALARYFPTRADRWYIEKGHAFGILLTDYPKLLRDLSLGFKVTTAIAKDLESTQNFLEYGELTEGGILPTSTFEPNDADEVGELDAALF